MKEEWPEKTIRRLGLDELLERCATEDVLTFLGESVATHVLEPLGLTVHPGEASSDRRVYLKQELAQDTELLARLRDDDRFHTVVGIGSGWLCDIAKIVGYKRRCVLVPSALTTNGPFTHKAVADERFMALVSSRFEPGSHSVVTGYPDELLVCHELLTRPGNARFNQAGLGDPLASITGIHDNELADRAIIDPDERRKFCADLHPEINEEARQTIDRVRQVAKEVRQNSKLGVDIIVEALDASARWHLIAPRVINGSEHSFAEAGETILQGKGMLALHGELLAVGVLCMLELQGRSSEVAPTRAFFRSLGLPVHYETIGLTHDETVCALCQAVDCRSDKYGILQEVSDGDAFESAVEAVFDREGTPPEEKTT
ncbi:MAG: iron-containing alcohol dehydrogenase [Nitrospiraceae bacterium]|nr:iron-containing alcohol dehydrogenase [Nitrospiraceae bacterium]